jgi:hypothetical protein
MAILPPSNSAQFRVELVQLQEIADPGLTDPARSVGRLKNSETIPELVSLLMLSNMNAGGSILVVARCQRTGLGSRVAGRLHQA